MLPTSPSTILLALLASAATAAALRPAAHEGSAERRVVHGRAHAGRRLIPDEGDAPAVDAPRAALADDAEREHLGSLQGERTGLLSKRSYECIPSFLRSPALLQSRGVVCKPRAQQRPACAPMPASAVTCSRIS